MSDEPTTSTTDIAHHSWPSEPGVPMNSGETGPHQLTHAEGASFQNGPWTMLWCAPERLWTDLFGNRLTPSDVSKHRYLGPMKLVSMVDQVSVAGME